MRIEQWLGEDNQLGIDIWKKKYQQDNETFDEWLDRVSGGNEAVKRLIIEKKFLFGGRILSNRGMEKRGRKVTYSNCYVIQPPEDNIESIFDAAKRLARTFSYGGGCGIDISKLAPRGAVINNTAKETTGAVSFMQLYNMVTDLIGQNGRRGALMLSLDCNHPDLEEFISIKNDLNSITKANISVRVDDEFMNAVVHDLEHIMIFHREETGEEICKKVRARDIFRKLCENNWNYAEPGILYWDTISSYNLLSTDDEFEYAGINPCAEEPLPAGGSCLLGSLNLSAFVTPNNNLFDMDSFRRAVATAVRALNEVLDEGLPLHPLEEQRKTVGDWRQIGLGIFGLADMLIKMGIKYGSDDAVALCDKIGEAMAYEALYESALLAAEYGPYPKFKADKVMSSDFYIRHSDSMLDMLIETEGLRNSQLLTIAPTGSLSTMLGVSGGIEPIFDTHYTRKTESLHNEETYYTVYTPIVKQYMDNTKITDLKLLPEYFITAKQLDGDRRILMQAVWQGHIDASISSTVNLPETATVEDVEDLYIKAWRHGLKGMTIFRENCARLGVLVSTDGKKEEKNEVEQFAENVKEMFTPEQVILKRGDWAPIPDDTIYVKRKIYTGCGKLNLFVGWSPSEQRIAELYVKRSAEGGCEHNIDATVICMSGMLRLGGTLDNVKKAFSGCGACNSFTRAKAKGKQLSKGKSCPTAILYAVEEAVKDLEKGIIFTTPEKEEPLELKQFSACTGCTGNCNSCPFSKKSSAKCPDCGGDIANSGGCVICPNCGYSKCD